MNEPTTEPKIIDKTFTKPSPSRQDQEEARTVKDLSKDGRADNSMEIKVASPFNIYFTGQAFSISAVNATGPFDILPKHHKFISLLQPCTLVIRTTGGEESKINIDGGLIHVKEDKVTVFLDI